jgi:hypothetical protein
MTMSLIDEFLADECNPHVVGVIRNELANRPGGEAYLTFNRFNLRLDVDNGIATIEDDLDPDSEMSLPIADLLARLPEH